MKKLLFILLIIGTFFSCSGDGDVFKVDTEKINISFESSAGSIYMTYKLPDDPSIYGISAKYIDDNGVECTVKGTVYDDKVKLTGFVNENDAVKVAIYLINYNDVYSAPIYKTFKVSKCSAHELFDKVEVVSYWYGFKVKYNNLTSDEGFLNVGYVGKSPSTGKIDTLLLGTYPLKFNGSTHLYSDIIGKDAIDTKMTVVLWTEDYRGNLVQKEVYENIKADKVKKLDCSKIQFVSGVSLESEKSKCGWKYLFDGDTNGVQSLEKNDGFYTFVTKDGVMPCDIIFDMGEQVNFAKISIFSRLDASYWVPNDHYESIYYSMWNWKYYSPCHIEVYGSNDVDAASEDWDKLGEFVNDRTIPFNKRWNARILSNDETYEKADDLKTAEPCYVSVNFDNSPKSYKYMKLRLIERYTDQNDSSYANINRFSIQEIEIFTKE